MLIIYYNFIWILSLLSLYGTIIYYVYQLNYKGVFFTLILAISTFIILKKQNKVKKHGYEFIKPNKIFAINIKDWAFIIMFMALWLGNFFIIWQSRTNESIISPWETIPWYFFVSFMLLSLTLFITLIKTDFNKHIYILLLSLYIFLPFSIGWMIYETGFGFDPFIHQATEKLINLTGAVNPKPWYYVGQYSLIVVVHKILWIPISWLDKLLVPILSSLLLPYAFVQAFNKWSQKYKLNLVGALLMMLLPFSIFVVTTPQNLANLWLTLLVLISLIPQEKLPAPKIITLYLLAFSAFASHPIAGIPAIMFILVFHVGQIIKNKKINAIFYTLAGVASATALPAAFSVTNHHFNINDYNTSFQIALPKLFLFDLGNIWLNFSYLYGFNIFWIIICIIIIALILILKNKNEYKIAQYRSYIFMMITLFISYIITNTLNFSYLIEYERSNFSNRILTLIIIFALPFIMTAIVSITRRVMQQNNITIYLWIIFSVSIITASVYYSYPRLDDYYNSRSFSTSQSDIEAVHWISKDAGTNDNFIVLANQQVSAAALQEFGFKKYFHTANKELFYYPIPTGDRLYQFYLNMVYGKADKKTALKAADLVGADTVYFVLNNYWFAFEKILAEAESSADYTESINGNKIFIFKYKK